MKPKKTSTTEAKREQKSTADQQLGGQPENDKDAQDLGFKSATSEAKPKKQAPARGR